MVCPQLDHPQSTNTQQMNLFKITKWVVIERWTMEWIGRKENAPSSAGKKENAPLSAEKKENAPSSTEKRKTRQLCGKKENAPSSAEKKENVPIYVSCWKGPCYNTLN